MPVPEAAMDKEDNPLFGEVEIRGSRQFLHVAIKCHAQRSKQVFRHSLRCGILSANCTHDFAAFSLRKSVGHCIFHNRTL